jgi:hypothetical protein
MSVAATTPVAMEAAYTKEKLASSPVFATGRRVFSTFPRFRHGAVTVLLD